MKSSQEQEINICTLAREIFNYELIEKELK